MKVIQRIPYQIEPASCSGKMTVAEALKSDEPTHIYEEKYDGARYLLQINPHSLGQNFLTSRRISKVTERFVEKQDYYPNIRDSIFPEAWNDTILDGEIFVEGGISSDVQHAMVEGKGTLYYWDILFYKGEDVRMRPLHERKKLLNEFAKFELTWAQPVRVYNSSKVLKEILQRKGEGIIIKDLTAPYGKGWIKVKAEDTQDVIITGVVWSTEGKYAQQGWIKSLTISQYVNGKLVEVGQASGFNEELRKDFSVNTKKYLGRPIEIKYQQRLPSGKFRSPRFMRFRDDKNPKDCVFK